MKRRVGLLVGLFILLLIAGCDSNQSKTIAEVNGQKITQSQFNERYSLVKSDLEVRQGSKLDEKKDQELIKNLKETTYNDIILQTLLTQDAEKQNVKVDDKDIELSLNTFKERQNQYSVDGYSKFLKDMNITEKQLKQEIKTELLTAKMQDKVSANISVSDAVVKKYYDDNPDQFKDAGGIQIYHILVKDEKLAQDIIVKLQKGEDFAKLAGEYSIDGSKTKGGDVGTVNENTNFVPEFKQAALALKPGEFTQKPVKSEFGYHVIKAGDKKGPGVITFEKAKDQIKSTLEKDKKDQAFNTYLGELKKKAQIKDLRSKQK